MATSKAVLERREKALDYRTRGWAYRDIAKALGVSLAQAYKDVNYELAEAKSRARENADELLQLELDRLDMLLKGLEPMARVGNPGAVNSYLKVMERRAKLLGLDAPAKTDITSDGEKLGIVIRYADPPEPRD